jgi:CheY-like chemotaxis protein
MSNTTPKVALVVDDDSAARDYYVDFFGVKGMNVRVAENGKVGLEIARKEPIDLILLDLAMPVMSGEDFLEEVCKDEKLKKIPIIVETAMGTPGTGRDKIVQKRFGDKLRLVTFTRGGSSWDHINKAVDDFLKDA